VAAATCPWAELSMVLYRWETEVLLRAALDGVVKGLARAGVGHQEQLKPIEEKALQRRAVAGGFVPEQHWACAHGGQGQARAVAAAYPAAVP
jgi:hypothetical protein